MIGKSLNERYTLGALEADRAESILSGALPKHAALLVQVRSRDAKMIACLVVDADEATVRECRTMGFDVKAGGSGVFGLLGADLVRFFSRLPAHQQKWLETPCGPRETKVFLMAGGLALLSVETNDGKVAIKAIA
ncbi:hypothetical protein [Labilithrix luteola]|nr:hypothetical protein [Labilithrix luteola]